MKTSFIFITSILLLMVSCGFQTEEETNNANKVTIKVVPSPTFHLTGQTYTDEQMTQPYKPSGTGEVVHEKLEIALAPVIFSKSNRPYCRWRPFKINQAYEDLLTSGVNKEILDKYLSQKTKQNSEEASIYHQTKDNWIGFGLDILNQENSTLVITKIKYSGEAKCDLVKTLKHSGEIASNYCSGEDTVPYLYIVPSVTTNYKVYYKPQSTNPFDNLSLYIDGFKKCDSSSESHPSYTVELTVSGFFMNSDGTKKDRFLKKLKFSTEENN